MYKKITPKQSIKTAVTIPGDKSISHRSIILGAIAQGLTEIEGFLMGEDCLATISCFQKLGIQIEIKDEKVYVYGKGLHGLSAPSETLDVGNSGTTLRLLSGILSAQPFTCQITGDASIQKRPMDRIAIPLRQMGGRLEGDSTEKLLAPFTIIGQPLKGIDYILPVASAQVKSAILLASLYAQGETTVTEPQSTRDHTEIMLNYMGANIKKTGNKIICHPVSELFGKKIIVPGDISSAAYFIVAGCICPDSELLLKNVGMNQTRTGILDVLLRMGADIEMQNIREYQGEKVSDILVKSSKLSSTVIGEGDIPRLIDEIPVLAVAACFAEGETIIKDAEELKVKESNRIKTVVTELKKFGANIRETDDGMVIRGGVPLMGCTVESYHDHRIAMSMAVAALCAIGETVINESECVDISFPGFYDVFAKL